MGDKRDHNFKQTTCVSDFFFQNPETEHLFFFPDTSERTRPRQDMHGPPPPSLATSAQCTHTISFRMQPQGSKRVLRKRRHVSICFAFYSPQSNLSRSAPARHSSARNPDVNMNASQAWSCLRERGSGGEGGGSGAACVEAGLFIFKWVFSFIKALGGAEECHF